MCFRLAPKSSTLDDLNGQNALYCRKDAYFGAHCTNLNEGTPILSATKMYANDSSFWKYKVCGYSWGFLLAGPQMRVGLSTIAFFWRFEWLLLRKLQRQSQQYYMTIYYPLSACDWLHNEWPRMTLSGYFMSKSVFRQHFLTHSVWLSKNNCVKSNKHSDKNVGQ